MTDNELGILLSSTVMAATRGILKYGSGNMSGELLARRNQNVGLNIKKSGDVVLNENEKRTNLAYSDATHLISQRCTNSAWTKEDEEACIRRYGCCAMYYRAGNCDQHAYLAFVLLCLIANEFSSYLDGKKLTVSKCANSKIKHAYVTFTVGKSKEIACDPWPLEGVACYWDDHFCNCDGHKVSYTCTPDTDFTQRYEKIWSILSNEDNRKKYGLTNKKTIKGQVIAGKDLGDLLIANNSDGYHWQHLRTFSDSSRKPKPEEYAVNIDLLRKIKGWYNDVRNKWDKPDPWLIRFV